MTLAWVLCHLYKGLSFVLCGWQETADAALKAAQEITAAVAAEFGSGKGALSKGMEAKEGDATSLPFAGITNISQVHCPRTHALRTGGAFSCEG